MRSGVSEVGGNVIPVRPGVTSRRLVTCNNANEWQMFCVADANAVSLQCQPRHQAKCPMVHPRLEFALVLWPQRCLLAKSSRPKLPPPHVFEPGRIYIIKVFYGSRVRVPSLTKSEANVITLTMTNHDEAVLPTLVTLRFYSALLPRNYNRDY